MRIIILQHISAPAALAAFGPRCCPPRSALFGCGQQQAAGGITKLPASGMDVASGKFGWRRGGRAAGLGNWPKLNERLPLTREGDRERDAASFLAFTLYRSALHSNRRASPNCVGLFLLFSNTLCLTLRTGTLASARPPMSVLRHTRGLRCGPHVGCGTPGPTLKLNKNTKSTSSII